MIFFLFVWILLCCGNFVSNDKAYIFIAWLRLLLCYMFLIFGGARAVYIAVVKGEWKLVFKVGYNSRTMFRMGNEGSKLLLLML